jgi:lysophospholipase L1-like esterase
MMPSFRSPRCLCLLSLLLCSLPGGGIHATVHAQTPPSDMRWVRQVAELVADAPVQREVENAVVFAGSSSIALWPDLHTHFPSHAIVNRGIGGLLLADLADLADGLILRWQPPLVVVYAGENDLAAGQSVADVVASFKRLRAHLRAESPGTHLLFLALKPSPWRAALTTQFREANLLIAAACADDAQATFVDLFTPLLDGRGEPRPELYAPDGLHLNDAGYQIWNTLLTSALAGARPTPDGRPLVRRWSDDFSGSLANWVVEQQPGGTVVIEAGRLVVHDVNGCTVWFRERLQAPVRIRYTATVSSRSRVSDLNCFWMATDPDHPADLFHPDHTRDGTFASYDQLATYYVGYGGNDNSTTRFRRYDGTGAKPLRPEHDLRDPEHLLRADHRYQIELVVEGNRVQYWRDGELVFDVEDPGVFGSGWFGFRTIKSRIEYDDFEVWSAAPARTPRR